MFAIRRGKATTLVAGVYRVVFMMHKKKDG